MTPLKIHRIDDRRAELLHFRDRLVGDADAIAVGQGRFDHELAHHPESFPGQGFFVGVVAISDRLLAVRRGSDVIPRIVSRHDFQHDRRILDGAAKRPAAIAAERQRHDAGATHPALGRDHTDQIIDAAGLRTEPDVSVPRAQIARLAATAAPEPALDPPGMRLVS